MTADRLVAGAVGRWTALATALVVGLAWGATAVESVAHGLGAALVASLLLVPALVTPLAPLLCALGAGLAAARLEARGERSALEACGLGPWRTGRAALATGLFVGVACWTVQGHLVHRAEAALQRQAAELAVGWVWLPGEPGTAARLSDGTAYVVDDGEISPAPAPADPTGPAVARARMIRRPQVASAAALAASPLATARLERHVRLAHVLACGLLAWVGWLPLARRAGTQATLALGVAAVWQVGDLAHQAAAAQGRIPLLVGAWAPVALVALALVVAGARGRRGQSFTTSQ